jgi:hypothetical protein
MGHVVMENRNGLVVATEMTPATGTAEREAAVAMVEQLADGQRITLGADKAYDTTDFVAEMRRWGVTPHVVAKFQRPALGHRRPHHAPSRLCDQCRRCRGITPVGLCPPSVTPRQRHTTVSTAEAPPIEGETLSRRSRPPLVV